METRSKATRDQALSEVVLPPAEFPARIGETTPESGDLGDIGAAGIVGDSRSSSTSPLTGVISPHMSVHEADVTGVDGPPLLQRADLAPTIDPSHQQPLYRTTAKLPMPGQEKQRNFRLATHEDSLNLRPPLQYLIIFVDEILSTAHH